MVAVQLADGARLQAVRRGLMAWYRVTGRHGLPWRQTRDPYAILISEVMLQQTQVERVLPYYAAWMARWPGFEALAAASPAEVIEQWAGLGYNRRAVNLQRLAMVLRAQYAGRLPHDDGGLRSLPGVGPYTASAVRSFAFEEGTAVVDTNVGRVLARIFMSVASVRDAGTAQIQGVATDLLPRRSVRDHNLALMDLGALVCRARGPECAQCPVARQCAWRLAGQPVGVDRTATNARFEDTARFARGRIVDALRGGAGMTADDLRAGLPERHRGHVDDYLSGLQRDGLVEEVGGGIWRLPTRLTSL